MYPRLILAKNLLTEDGVIFISIDDNEQSNLNMICHKIFGKENFVGQFVWETKRAARGVPPKNLLMHNHEYILCYSKKQELMKFIGIKRKESDFSNPDNDPRGLWRSESIKATGKQQNHYEIVDPETGNTFTGNWAFSEKSILRMISENLILFPQNRHGVPRQKKFFNSYTNENKAGITSLGWYSTENATNYLMRLFDGVKVFDFPKPVDLITYLFNQILSKTDIFMDFFSGSSTTAQVIMELNKEDGGGRRFIQVQLPEPTDQNSDAYKSGFRTIAEIGKERIRRVAKKIREEDPITAQNMDLGFRVFKLDSSNIKSWDGSLENLEQSLYDSLDNIKEDRTQEDVLYEILLKYGLDLSLPVEERTFENQKVFNVGSGALFVCLGDAIDSSVSEGIGKWKQECNPETCRVVFKDSGFTDVEKVNSFQILKRYGIREARSI